VRILDHLLQPSLRPTMSQTSLFNVTDMKSVDGEKPTNTQIESPETVGTFADEAVGEKDKTLDRKTLLNLDLLLVPMMCAIYLLAFLDRANIGNARVAGLQSDLRITDIQYQIGNLPHLRRNTFFG
jgi:hypothetical protein